MSAKVESSDGNEKSGTVPVASGIFKTLAGKDFEIRDVWAHNFEEEMEIIREMVENFPYIAMDTEFPGVVAHPAVEYGATDAQYQTMKCNVDLLKLIQLGVTFADEKGEFIEGCTCWQFNFKFSLEDDIYAEDSIELLKNSGIDFERFERQGIDAQHFGEVLMMSGLVLNKDVKWLTFHSSYDFGYLLKTLTGDDLPADETAFLDIFHTYFPCSYDLKSMMQAFDGLHGGLSALADGLDVKRIGPMHQAGSDSLLTSQAYFAFVEKYRSGSSVFDHAKFQGDLFGIGVNQQAKFKKYHTSSYNDFGVQSGSAFPHSTSTPSLLATAVSSSFNVITANSKRNINGIANVASYSALDSVSGSVLE